MFHTFNTAGIHFKPSAAAVHFKHSGRFLPYFVSLFPFECQYSISVFIFSLDGVAALSDHVRGPG